MGLLKPVTNQTEFIKAGFLGFQGSGKTRTAFELAAGLSRERGKHKRVAFFDTEKGSDFMLPAAKLYGIELVVVKSRAFKDLVDVIPEALGSCDVLLIDSVSHVWAELMDAYQKKLNRKRLEFQDWGPIKGEWAKFATAFINSPMHTIVCGRAKFTYEDERNEETGKREIFKTGTAMKAEGEFGYESDVLIEMERVEDEKAGRTLHRAHVIKDRNLIVDPTSGELRGVMDGAVIDDPTYESWAPIVKLLAGSGAHFGVDAGRNSQSLIEAPDHSGLRRRERVQCAIEEITACFELAEISGQSKEGKKRIAELCARHFGATSWKQLESFTPDVLQRGLLGLRTELGQLAPEEIKRLADAESQRHLAEAQAAADQTMAELDLEREPGLDDEVVELPQTGGAA